jgi:hypothetical protein
LLLFLFIFSWEAFAQTPPPEPRLSDDTIIRELSRRMQWDWFWNGYTHPNYIEGKPVSLAILESPTEVAVFLAELGEYVTFDFGGRITGSRGFPATTNEAAMNEYLRTYGDTAGLRLIPSIPEGTAPRQARSDPRTIEEKRAAMKQRSLNFVLPKLEPPAHIVRGEPPAGLPSFEAAVRAQARDWHSPECGPGQLSIPNFADDDAIVYVYADFGACGTGIFDFHRLPNGRWQVGKLWPHRPPQDWSQTIQQILKHRLLTIPLP